jgi:hypothetical protein
MTDTIYPRQEIFVWEDLVFNLQAHDVVKSNRFVGDHSGMMIRTKKRGGPKSSGLVSPRVEVSP